MIMSSLCVYQVEMPGSAPLYKEGFVLRKNIMEGPHKKGEPSCVMVQIRGKWGGGRVTYGWGACKYTYVIVYANLRRKGRQTDVEAESIAMCDSTTFVVLTVSRGKRTWKQYYAYLKGFLLYFGQVCTFTLSCIIRVSAL